MKHMSYIVDSSNHMTSQMEVHTIYQYGKASIALTVL